RCGHASVGDVLVSFARRECGIHAQGGAHALPRRVRVRGGAAPTPLPPFGLPVRRRPPGRPPALSLPTHASETLCYFFVPDRSMHSGIRGGVMARSLDGKKVAQEVRERLKGRVARLAEKGIVPGLSVTLVGEDPASKVYVASKDAAAKDVGMRAWTHRLPADTSEDDLRAHLVAQNNDPAVHGILLQLPLPKHLPEESLLNLIVADKDVDGFHPVSLGNVMLGR